MGKGARKHVQPLQYSNFPQKNRHYKTPYKVSLHKTNIKLNDDYMKIESYNCGMKDKAQRKSQQLKSRILQLRKDCLWLHTGFEPLTSDCDTGEQPPVSQRSKNQHFSSKLQKLSLKLRCPLLKPPQIVIIQILPKVEVCCCCNFDFMPLKRVK